MKLSQMAERNSEGVMLVNQQETCVNLQRKLLTTQIMKDAIKRRHAVHEISSSSLFHVSMHFNVTFTIITFKVIQ